MRRHDQTTERHEFVSETRLKLMAESIRRIPPTEERICFVSSYVSSLFLLSLSEHAMFFFTHFADPFSENGNIILRRAPLLLRCFLSNIRKPSLVFPSRHLFSPKFSACQARPVSFVVVVDVSFLTSCDQYWALVVTSSFSPELPLLFENGPMFSSLRAAH